MLSMAAAKKSRKDHAYRARALAYQSQALHHLRADICQATAWSTELIFVILMLGMSTAWHDVTDLGIPHLRAMQQAVRYLNNGTTDGDKCMLEFFRNALVYWEMVTAFMDKDAPVYEHSKPKATFAKLVATCEPYDDSHSSSRDPHPWTGIASIPQRLFTRLVRLVQRTRAQIRSGSTSEEVACEQAEILQAAEDLERELWTFRLPNLHEIVHTGDERTPATHHLLLAEAYMFANFFQLYSCFPHLFRKRRSSWNVDAAANASYPAFVVDDPAFCKSDLWPSSTNLDEQQALLGISVIRRLQRLPSDSGTLCVQPLLLLIASTAISLTSEMKEDVFHLRQFVLDRLRHCSNAYLSEPMHRVLLTVIEIFKMLDQGRRVFWLDAIECTGLVTIIG